MKKYKRFTPAVAAVLLVGVLFLNSIAANNGTYYETASDFQFSNPVVYFGTYNGQQLLWEVVELDQGTNIATLFLTERLFVAPFNDVSNTEVNHYGANMWETSTLRTELNSRFYTIFNADEQAAVRPFYGDNLFLPSAAQYYAWFPNPAIRNSHPGNARGWWLVNSASPHLRNAGAPRHHALAMYVTMEIGRVAHTGSRVNNIKGVRPAVTVDATNLDFLMPQITPQNPRAAHNAGQFRTATIAGIPIDVGIGTRTDQIPTAAELDLLVGDRSRHGRVALTQQEAQGAVANFVPVPGDNVRVVRIPSEHYYLATSVNLQDGLSRFHDGQGAFYFHDTMDIAIPLDLEDGDIILIYYRGWIGAPMAHYVVVSVFDWDYTCGDPPQYGDEAGECDV